MRLRIKFSKTGQLKYIGHLDVMRYFQKVLRRAGVDVVFSGGFSPHMIMSFALPLGVGLTSVGEYFDVDVQDGYDYAGLAEKLNAFTAEDMRVLNAVQVSDKKADKCMTVVDAADYRIDFGQCECGAAGEKEDACSPKIREIFEKFCRQDEIMTVKKTKSGEKLTDIRPMILDLHAEDGHSFVLKLAAGSRAHLNPVLLADAFFASQPNIPEQSGWKRPVITRLEMYAKENGCFLPLDRCSGVIA